MLRKVYTEKKVFNNKSNMFDCNKKKGKLKEFNTEKPYYYYFISEMPNPN